jgi:hypothetical protein
MTFSAIPFWKWALTPQKVSRRPFALQLFLKALTTNHPFCSGSGVCGRKVFKGSFGFHCLFSGELGHQVDVLQS